MDSVVYTFNDSPVTVQVATEVVVSDVLDTLQMRLTSFYDDGDYMDILHVNSLTFGPFEDGLTMLSYENLIWYMNTLHGDDTWSPWALEWCTWAMNFVERNYILELIAKGYDLPLDEVDRAAHKLRNDMEVTILHKVESAFSAQRLPHLFSSVSEQRIFTTEH